MKTAFIGLFMVDANRQGKGVGSQIVEEVDMFLFGGFKRNKELDNILNVLQMDAENNYKDAAQMDLKKFEELLQKWKDASRLNEKQIKYYDEQLMLYKAELQKFTHKDQKVTW